MWMILWGLKGFLEVELSREYRVGVFQNNSLCSLHCPKNQSLERDYALDYYNQNMNMFVVE